MKKYIVTIELIAGYNNIDYDNPIIKTMEYTVQANNETEAMEKAGKLDDSKLSVWQSYADECL